MIRLYVNAVLAAGADVAPSVEQARYLTTVMRLGVGDGLLLFNGRDGEWSARVAEVGKRGARLAVEAMTRPQAGTPDVELVVALVKRARLETIVEKATELGVRRVRLAITRRTNADHTNVPRLQAIAVEAAEQTGRLDVPEVVGPVKLERLLEGWDETRRLMFCDEGLEPPPPCGEGAGGGGVGSVWASWNLTPPSPTPSPPPTGRGSILIGPEGGFSPEERTHLRSLPIVTPVTLGPRILRADTAAIAALTLWQAALGDWRGHDLTPS